MSFDLQPTTVVQVDQLLQRFSVECAQRGYSHERAAHWPAHPDQSALDVGSPLLASIEDADHTSVIRGSEDALAQIRVNGGMTHVYASGATPLAAAECIERIRELLPEHVSESADIVPVTFWTASQTGGRSIRRDIDAAAWEAIRGNYPGADNLDGLMSPAFRPGAGGQLILWHGDAGTGKTTALRALAREWRDWADLHYIVDPDTFFGHRADYMMEVLTGGDEVKYAGEKSVPRWRVLVLEDCGELLQPDAKREVGQALARLLNACDGLIGRGLRILVLLTTNEPVEKLHEAVARPGRCAALVDFPPFSSYEAAAWLEGRDVDHGPLESMALADLFAMTDGFRERPRSRSVGFAVA